MNRSQITTIEFTEREMKEIIALRDDLRKLDDESEINQHIRLTSVKTRARQTLTQIIGDGGH